MSNGDSRFVAPTTSRLRVMRDGHNIIRSARIPKPAVLVDTREREPFPLLENHPNWIGGERRVALKTGDYTVEGMESLLCLERKSLADLVACTVTESATVPRRLRSAGAVSSGRRSWSKRRWRTSRGGFEIVDIPSGVHPNAVCGRWTPSRPSSASPSSTRPPTRNLRRSEPRVGFRSTSPTGGWSSRASVVS